VRNRIEISTFRSVADKQQFWVSASDAARTPPGQYQWADGTQVDNSTWASGQPNEAGVGKEMCVGLYTGEAKLFDWICPHTAHFLCEIPAALSSCFS